MDKQKQENNNENNSQEMINTVICGDALETVKTFPDESIDSVITSPPYYQLRDYGWNGQWGLEKNYREYLDKLIALMSELKRVLKPTGTMFINLGDTYSTGQSGLGGRANSSAKQMSNKGSYTEGHYYDSDIPNKSLMLIPHRFAIRCIDELGLILRNDIIWAKRNGMPESVTDRFSKKHEFFFLFVKQQKYYFDLDGVRDKHQGTNRLREAGNGEKRIYDKLRSEQHSLGKNRGDVSDFWDKSKYDDKESESKHRQGMNKERGSGIVEKRPYLPPQEAFVNTLRENFNIDEIVNKTGLSRSKVEHWFRYDKSGFAYPAKEDWELLETDLWKYELCTVIYETDGIEKNAYKGKNSGDVSDFWDIPTQPSSEKHYATYNFKLIDKPIIAGCPEGGIILDPFCGTGTTLVRAIQLGRQGIGIDGSQEYCEIAQKRIEKELAQLKLSI